MTGVPVYNNRSAMRCPVEFGESVKRWFGPDLTARILRHRVALRHEFERRRLEIKAEIDRLQQEHRRHLLEMMGAAPKCGLSLGAVEPQS